MSVELNVIPAQAGIPGQESEEVQVARSPDEIPASAGMTRRFRRAALTVGGVAGGLLALDFLGFLVTVYFSAELVQYAQQAGVAGLLPK